MPAINIGGGMKIPLLGPIRVRADYRVFQLRGSPLHTTYQRFYVGGNLAFYRATENGNPSGFFMLLRPGLPTGATAIFANSVRLNFVGGAANAS